MAAEKNFENKVKKFLKEQGCYFIKYWGGGAFTKSGVPDLLVCYNGYFVGVELKAENGKPSELQIHNLNEINKSGGYGILLYPEKFNQFKQLIWLLKYPFCNDECLNATDYFQENFYNQQVIINDIF